MLKRSFGMKWQLSLLDQFGHHWFQHQWSLSSPLLLVSNVLWGGLVNQLKLHHLMSFLPLMILPFTLASASIQMVSPQMHRFFSQRFAQKLEGIEHYRFDLSILKACSLYFFASHVKLLQKDSAKEIATNSKVQSPKCLIRMSQTNSPASFPFQRRLLGIYHHLTCRHICICREYLPLVQLL